VRNSQRSIIHTRHRALRSEHLIMALVNDLTAPFFNNPQYSDITVKFGKRQVRAHKILLAQQSGYFATAFFSRFQVSIPVLQIMPN